MTDLEDTILSMLLKNKWRILKASQLVGGAGQLFPTATSLTGTADFLHFLHTELLELEQERKDAGE